MHWNAAKDGPSGYNCTRKFYRRLLVWVSIIQNLFHVIQNFSLSLKLSKEKNI